LNGCVAAIVPQNPATRLRVATAADASFIRDLVKTSRAGEFASTGLSPAALDKVLEQQFLAQSAGYAAQFPDAVSMIVLLDDEPVGRLLLSISERRWRIVDIMLRPAARGGGVGSDLIGSVARAAHAHGAQELALSVLSTNTAARRLYLRLGFVETGGGVYTQMAKRLTS
jgi:RimJ/RimL family protein N-acetyltransferase